MHLFHSISRMIPRVALVACLASSGAINAFAEEPGTGKTAHFEVHYLKMMIDHHYSALRMTELAAGTEMEITDQISPHDRVHPSPGFDATEPHAVLPDIKSMSRSANRMQREEILTAQKFLKDWYGMEHEPRLSTQAHKDIAKLDALQGAEFDKAFWKPSRDITIKQRSLHCNVSWRVI